MTSPAFGATQTAKVNGTTLAYREVGEGEPVVFVHGSISDMRVWDQQLPDVGRAYRAITYSRRYARPNEDIEPGIDDTMPLHVEDLAAFLREIDAAPAHLVGNSWGAYISLLTAIRHPQLVRTLVLEEPPLLPLLTKHTPPSPIDVLRLLVTRPRTAIAMLRVVASVFVPAVRAFRRDEDEKALQIFSAGAGGQEAYEKTPAARIEIARENVAALKAQLLGEGFPPLADDEVRGVRPPVLLMTGANSPEFMLRLTDRLEELLPDPERVEIPDASHAMHEENAPAVNDAILEFLGRHRGGPASASSS